MEIPVPIQQAREQLEADRSLEAMNILMEAWHASPGDPDLRLELARVGRVLKSLRHRQILCQEIGDRDPRFGRDIDERYLILERISETLGFSVYHVQDEKLGRPATLWFIEPLWRNSILSQDWVMKRLRALQEFDHPNVARLQDCGAPADDLVFAALDPPDGSLISDCITTAGPFPLTRAVEIVLAILEALAAGHEQKIFHGNLRTDHIVLREGGIRILDYGLYAMTRELHRARKVTRTGQVPGAPAYLPPEFDGPAEPSAPWDVCSAGALAFELITGKPPYGRPEPRQLRSFLAKMKEPIPPVGQGLPPWIDEVLGRMLARDPSARYQTANDAIQGFRDALS
ncbi:MAG: serine/threonine-protein kinase [Planctomycetota bacterium]|nr:serine/threonine-protein kinase [Planctomycetota bacterium]